MLTGRDADSKDDSKKDKLAYELEIFVDASRSVKVTWTDLPDEIILYIASFLEIKDLCQFFLLDKKTHEIGLAALADQVTVNNDFLLKGRSSADIRQYLRDFASKQKELSRLQSQSLDSNMAEEVSSLSCVSCTLCLIGCGFLGFITTLFHFSNSNELGNLSNDLLMGVETSAAFGVGCAVIKCGAGLFAKRRKKTNEAREEVLQEALNSNVRISYRNSGH